MYKRRENNRILHSKLNLLHDKHFIAMFRQTGLNNFETIAKAPLNPSSSHQEKSAKSHIS
jgi:hypothetical protein